MIIQAEVVERLLTKESVTVIGLLLAFCALLIWDKVRQEKAYKELLDKYDEERTANKEALIDLVTKNILANEHTIQTIKTIRDVYKDK